MASNKKEYDKEYRIKNRKRITSNLRKWERNNPDKVKDNKLRENYGITLKQKLEMVSNQESKCLICKRHFSNLVVDRDHKTGKVRGLLCKKCNHGIGFLMIIRIIFLVPVII